MRWLAAGVIVALIIVDYLYYDEFGAPPQVERFLEDLTSDDANDEQAAPAREVAGPGDLAPGEQGLLAPTRGSLGEASPGRSGSCPSPPCAWDYEPVISKVSWEQRPTLGVDGSFSFIARIEEGHSLVLPSRTQQGVSNVALVAGTTLYGSVIPPAGPGYSWDPAPGQYIAHTYEYVGDRLTVEARLSGNLYSTPGMEMCLWSGGTTSQAYILGCTGVDKR